MSDPREPSRSRRELLRSSLRYLATGGIVLGSAGLVCRGTGSSAGSECRRSLPCRDCAAMSGCRLPRARAAKK